MDSLIVLLPLPAVALWIVAAVSGVRAIYRQKPGTKRWFPFHPLLWFQDWHAREVLTEDGLRHLRRARRALLGFLGYCVVMAVVLVVLGTSGPG